MLDILNCCFKIGLDGLDFRILYSKPSKLPKLLNFPIYALMCIQVVGHKTNKSSVAL